MLEELTVACQKCGQEMVILATKTCRTGICEKCIAAMDPPVPSVDDRRRREAAWTRGTLAFKAYLDTDLQRLPVIEKSRAAMEHVLGSMGLNLWGDVATGKTRTMIAVLRQAHERGKTFRVFGPSDFREELERQGWNTGGFLNHCRTRDIIAFDDVGKMRLTPLQEDHFFAIIEYFRASKKPIILTHNYDGEELTARFKQHGEAIVNRIRACCRSIHFP